MITLGQWLSIFLNAAHSNTIYICIIEMGILSKNKNERRRLPLHLECEIFSDILPSLLHSSHLWKTVPVKNHQIYFTTR